MDSLRRFTEPQSFLRGRLRMAPGIDRLLKRPEAACRRRLENGVRCHICDGGLWVVLEGLKKDADFSKQGGSQMNGSSILNWLVLCCAGLSSKGAFAQTVDLGALAYGVPDHLRAEGYIFFSMWIVVCAFMVIGGLLTKRRGPVESSVTMGLCLILLCSLWLPTIEDPAISWIDGVSGVVVNKCFMAILGLTALFVLLGWKRFKFGLSWLVGFLENLKGRQDKP